MSEQPTAGTSENGAQPQPSQQVAQESGQQNPQEQHEPIPYESYKVIQGKYHALSRELDQMKQDAQAQKEKQLAEQSKYKELYEQKNGELLNLQKQIDRERKVNIVQRSAMKHGALDVDVVSRIIDVDSVDAADEKAIEDKISSLKKEKGYLFGQTTKKTIGNDAGAPAEGAADVKTFKRSQLRTKEGWVDYQKAKAAKQPVKIIEG